MELSGAEIVVQCLKDEGVDCVFGYPGGAVLHIYDAIFKQDDVRHILVRHEQGATHAADGYARSTGKPGVALVTSGPGATNAVTGIATAFMDSIPMVVLTGQVPSPFIGSDAFQEVDTVGITRPCVKHNFLIKDVRHIAERLVQTSSEAYIIQGQEIKCTASVGIALVPKHGEELWHLISVADQAMYNAKAMSDAAANDTANYIEASLAS